MMAGDRRASWDWGKAQSMPKPKIRKRKGLLLGATGDCFLCSLFVDIMDIPKRKEKQTLEKYMFEDFYLAVKAELLVHGFADEHHILKIPEDIGCEVLVGVEGKVFIIDIVNTEFRKESTQGLILIDEVALPYAAGCGDSVEAILRYVLKTKKSISKADLKLAVQVIAEISPGCDDKIDILVED